MRQIIKQTLKENGWTQKRLSNESGVRQAAISNYLSGKGRLYSDNLESICQALDLKLTKASTKIKKQ